MGQAKRQAELDARLARCAQESADKIEDSAAFVVLFSDNMREDPVPLIQMGLAVYMDKPIYLCVPESDREHIPENVRRLARGIEYYDDSLPDGLRASAAGAATTRLMQKAQEDGVIEIGRPKGGHGSC